MHESKHRQLRRWSAVICMIIAGLALTGCLGAQEFRSASYSSIQAGVNAIADGLIDGFFAVFQPDTTTNTSSSTGA